MLSSFATRDSTTDDDAATPATRGQRRPRVARREARGAQAQLTSGSEDLDCPSESFLTPLVTQDGCLAPAAAAAVAAAAAADEDTASSIVGRNANGESRVRVARIARTEKREETAGLANRRCEAKSVLEE